MRFSKKKMIERLTEEGRADMITEKIIKIMDNLDCQEAHTNSWHRQVYGEPVLAVKGKDGSYFDVNESDCE